MERSTSSRLATAAIPSTARSPRASCSPVQGVLGLRIEQPMATDFGCSRRLLEHVLHTDQWPGDNDQTQIDLWLTTTAVSGGFKVCEGLVGSRRRGSARRGTGSQRHDCAGRRRVIQRASAAPRSGTVSRVGRRSGFRQRSDPARGAGRQSIQPPRVVSPRVSRALRHLGRDPAASDDPRVQELAAAPPESFRMDDRLWARTIYDFALGHRLRVIARDHLLRSLTPLYLGWLTSFILADGTSRRARSRRAWSARARRSRTRTRI